jgi:prefoldin subunit 5
MDKPDTQMATVYIKGGKDVQMLIEEAIDYLYNNADKIESRHRQVRRKMLTDSLITLENNNSDHQL